MTPDELVLAGPLAVTTAGPPVLLLPGRRIVLAPTDDPAVAHVLTVDGAGRQEAAGYALEAAVMAAARQLEPPAPIRVTASLEDYPQPVRDLGGRLRRIARNAERGAGYRRDLEALVDDLRRSGRPAHADLADRLVAAAGKPGNRTTGGRSLARLITTLDNTL